jgi:hypothetical protein
MSAIPISSNGLFRVSIVFALIFGIQCTKNTLEPKLDPQIINQSDLFEFKIVDIRSIDQQLVYQWQNNGITANIFNGSEITEGSGTMKIMDFGGTEVFSENLAAGGDFFSSSGESGKWMIELNLTKVSGTVHVRVERRF